MRLFDTISERFARRLLGGFAVALVLSGSILAQEVQLHGVVFERWIRDTFFDHYEPDSYTQKWDIPAAANLRFGGLPVNPKATKYGSAVGLGDALRQFDIAKPFILVLGFWDQDGPVKRFVNITPVTIHPETWRLLWGPVTRTDLERLDALIKNRDLDYNEVRLRAHEMKSAPPFSEALLILNPKIGAGPRGQRRLQCSLRFDHLFDLLASDANRERTASPSLWGVPFPGPVSSTERTFSHRADTAPSPDEPADQPEYEADDDET
jgi:hypothetical protein